MAMHAPGLKRVKYFVGTIPHFRNLRFKIKLCSGIGDRHTENLIEILPAQQYKSPERLGNSMHTTPAFYIFDYPI